MHFYTQIKELACDAFKVRGKLFKAMKLDQVMFSYGCPDGKGQYRPIPTDD